MAHRIPWFRSSLPLAALLLVLATPVHAQTWTETDDAGDLVSTAQNTAGSGPLTTINGTFGSPSDVDMYCININAPASFLAHINCVMFTNPDLWLFDAAGNGIALDDACAAGWVLIPSSFVSTSGPYYLAISGDSRDALSAGGNIWLSPWVSGARAPDGPGAAGTLLGWGGNATLTSSSYSITLAGTTFCDAATPAGARSWGRMKTLYR